MIHLYEHNKTTYENIIKLYEEHDRVVCVQPTGTGKSFIMLKLIEDNPEKKFLITSPSIYIFEQIRTHAKDNFVGLSNCEFCTYQKLVYMCSDAVESIDADYIILDEFHRLGSAEWGGNAARFLLKTHKNSKVLGTSATPIRYLDSMRNMAEELFDGCYAVNMNLAEAIRRNILPLPVYVTAWYSFSGEIARLEEKLAAVTNPYLKRKLYSKIRQAKSKLTETDCGIENILQKHIVNKNGKYIIFCPNVKSIESAQIDCRTWFELVNKNINVYSVYTDGENVREQFEGFKNDYSSDSLKILLCIDMLNEGVHIKDVDGVIMLRATSSANVFYQQLGRALSCSKSRPVIFDLVNNYETGNTADEYASMMEIRNIALACSDDSDICFEIYDYVRDIRTLLDEIYTTFEQSWDAAYETLCSFVNEYDRFPFQKEIYKGYRLGTWCDTQKSMYKKNQLSSERIEALEKIKFPWNSIDELWNGKFNILREFKEKNGRFIVRKDTLNNETLKIVYEWCNTQRQLYKTGRMQPERIEKLQGIGYELCVLSDDELWDKSYNELLNLYNKYQRFPTSHEIESQKLISWVMTQRGLMNDGKLSDEKIRKLNDIGFIWDVEMYRWNDKFFKLKQFVSENKRIPKTNESYDGFCLGQWYAKQVSRLNNGLLNSEQEKNFRSLGDISSTYSEELWLKKFELLKAFIAENGRLPYTHEVYNGVKLYSWINKQKACLVNNKLDDFRLDKLKSLNIDLLSFSSKKIDIEIPKNWLENYEDYKRFTFEKHRKPNRSKEEGKLYRWRRRQIAALEEKRLNNSQINLLRTINFE